MKKRIFTLPDGSVVVDHPSPTYQGGRFVKDLSKPIKEMRDVVVGYKEKNKVVPDTDKPVVDNGVFKGYVPKTIKVKGDPIIEKQEVIVGYEQKELTIADCKIPESLAGLTPVIEDVE